jgi:hypothetical protein
MSTSSHATSAEGQKKKSRNRPEEEVYRHIEKANMDTPQALRTLRSELPWRDWILIDFLRYWYIIGVLALVVFLTLGVAEAYHVRDPLGVIILAVVGATVAGLGYLGYRVLWPQGGLTRLEVLSKILRRIRRRRRRFQ